MLERTAVLLRDFPVALFDAGRVPWSDVLRDYLLRGIGGAEQPYDVDDLARSVRALDLVRVAATDAAEESPDVDRLDLVVPAEPGMAGDFAVLQGALDHARSLALAGATLTPPMLPELVELRDWICEEVMAQTAGAAPQPWRFTDRTDLHVEGDELEWDRAILPPPDVSWIVGDDHNRIVAASPAALALLGWNSGELVGQRLLAVIPDRLREQHVAGFTRGVVNGEHRLLGVPLELPALTRDGREVPVTLTLQRHPARSGRAVFLARLEPREESSAPVV